MMIKISGILVLLFFLVSCTSQQPIPDDKPQPFFNEVNIMKLTSSAFQHNGKIPSKYTCDGANINPPLKIEGVPPNAQSLVLIMDDPDIPNEVKQSRGIQVFDHWILSNIAPETTTIKENSTAGISGKNGRSENKYTGPCPPPQYEPKEHRYFFKLYALDSMLNLKEGASKADVENAIRWHIIAQTELVGRYQRI
jgi:Raf kinase inhibitor-like YbhB/YbcL family protein